MCGSNIFPTIRHSIFSYSCHISYDNFVKLFFIVHDFSYMSIYSEFSSCIIYNQRSLARSHSNFVSCVRCIFTSVNSIPSPCSLLRVAIYIRKKFWRYSCCTISTVSFSKCIFYICIHFSDWDNISFFEWSTWSLHSFQERCSGFTTIVSIKFFTISCKCSKSKWCKGNDTYSNKFSNM